MKTVKFTKDTEGLTFIRYNADVLSDQSGTYVLKSEADAIIDGLIESLESALKTAIQHPAFDELAYANYDIDALVKEGGDTCDWTMLAINITAAIAKAKGGK